MTTSTPAPAIQNPQKASWFSGCVVTALVILFVILGVYNFVSGSIIAYVFTSAGLLSFASIAVVFIIFCECIIYFFLVFRIKKQHWLISLALVALVWLILPLPLNLLINVSTARVRSNGYSMGKTLPDGSYILADRLAYQQKAPQRGDIVIFTLPIDPKQEMVKRVIGLPGETVAIKDGVVTINNAPINESFITEPPLYSGEWTVPKGQYFVLGDNRNNSADSHSWGFLPQENIIAKAVWIYYPLANFGKIGSVIFQP
jgi:signal peptidase I